MKAGIIGLGHGSRVLIDAFRINKIKVYGLVHVVCRRTNKEAEEYYNKYAVKMADKKAISNFISILNKSNKSSVLSSIQKSQLKIMAGGIGSLQ